MIVNAERTCTLNYREHGGRICADLRHNWLEKYMARNPQFIAHLQASEGDAAHVSFGAYIAPGGPFRARCCEASTFLEHAEQQFDPASLVDEGPLADRSPSFRDELKRALHERFRSDNPLDTLIADAAKAVESLDGALKTLSDAWHAKPRAESARIEALAAELRLHAASLHATLDQFPRGYVLR